MRQRVLASGAVVERDVAGCPGTGSRTQTRCGADFYQDARTSDIDRDMRRAAFGAVAAEVGHDDPRAERLAAVIADAHVCLAEAAICNNDSLAISTDIRGVNILAD